MSTEELANVPASLTIEGVDSAGEPVKIVLQLARSMPMAADVALGRDLIALGKRAMTPYDRLKPQLDSLAEKTKQAVAARDREAAEQFQMDRNLMIKNLADGMISGRADDLAEEAYYVAGRTSIDGLCRELADRSKHAGTPASLAELRAVITTGNAGLVFAQLQEALGEVGGKA